MKIRTVLSSSVLVLALAGTTACGDDSATKADSKSTTTTAPSEKKSADDSIAAGESGVTGATDEAPIDSEAPTTTASPEAWAESITKLQDQLTAAGTDLCKVVESLGSTSALSEPTNSDQVKSAVDYLADAFSALSKALPAENAAEAAALSKGAEDLRADAEKAGYPASYFTENGGPAVLSTPEFSTAIQTAGSPTGPAKNCAPATVGEAP